MSQEWESEWLSQAVSDPACFHATMFLAAAQESLVVDSSTTTPSPLIATELYQHKGEAIRIINERLNDPRTAAKNGTIVAIACLVVSEVCKHYSPQILICLIPNV
jgi:hypothetical protein